MLPSPYQPRPQFGATTQAQAIEPSIAPPRRPVPQLGDHGMAWGGQGAGQRFPAPPPMNGHPIQMPPPQQAPNRPAGPPMGWAQQRQQQIAARNAEKFAGRQQARQAQPPAAGHVPGQRRVGPTQAPAAPVPYGPTGPFIPEN